MKKITLFFSLFFCIYIVSAQNNQDSLSTSSDLSDFPQHEVNYNIANTLIMASAEVGYEFFFDFDQSVGVKFLINDRRNYHSENHGRKFKTNSIRLNYTYYFGSERPGSEFYIQPLIKYRFGDYEERNKYDDIVKTDMNDFMVGLGIGYIWNFSDSFVIGPFANIARGFSSKVNNKFNAVEFNAGLNLGYRF